MRGSGYRITISRTLNLSIILNVPFSEDNLREQSESTGDCENKRVERSETEKGRKRRKTASGSEKS